MDSHLKRLQAEYQRGRTFLTRDLWHVDLREVPTLRRKLYSLLRVAYIVIRGYIRDNCALQASALTYFSLMSLVPLLAITFSVAKGLGAKERLMIILNDSSSTVPTQIRDFATSVFELVDNTNLTALGLIGLLMIFWTVIRVMWKIESTFNSIWGVREGRTPMRRFTDYLAMLVIVPFLIMIVSAVNGAMANDHIVTMMQENLGPMYFLYAIVLSLVGLGAISLGFFLLYFVLPNTKVKFSAAVIGALCGGTLWLAWQWACINLQVLLNGYSTLYGAFATIPVSLFWVFLNWNIVLFGAEVCFAFQNHQTYVLEGDSDKSTFATRHSLALLLVQEICRAHHAGRGPWQPSEFQQAQHVPIRLIRQVLFDLVAANVLIEVPRRGFVPYRDFTTLTLRDVELAMRGTVDEQIHDLVARAGSPSVLSLLLNDRDYIQSLAATTLDTIIPAAPLPLPTPEPTPPATTKPVDKAAAADAAAAAASSA